MPIIRIVNRIGFTIDEKKLERSSNGGALTENHSGKKLGNLTGKEVSVEDTFLRTWSSQVSL